MKFHFIIILVVLLCSCNREVHDDELLKTSVKLEDGSYVYLIHRYNCSLKCRPHGRSYEPKKYPSQDIIKAVHYLKNKNHVYCKICIDSIHAHLLNSISQVSLIEYKEFLEDYEEYYGEKYDDIDNATMIDSSNRTFDVYYSYMGRIGEGYLKVLPSKYQNGWHLLDLDDDYKQRHLGQW